MHVLVGSIDLKMKNKAKKVSHPDHSEELVRLNKINGQIAGIQKMIHDRRYCPEIMQQIRAARSALRSVELSMMKGHMSACLKGSAQGSASDFERKLKEVLELIKD